MNTIAVILGILLISAVAYLIVKPLVQQAPQIDCQQEGVETLEREKESVFTTLAEIELDYQMGKLSEKDYLALQQKYKRQAVDLLQAEQEKAEDCLEQLVDEELEQEIEKELEEFRATLRQSSDAKAARG